MTTKKTKRFTKKDEQEMLMHLMPSYLREMLAKGIIDSSRVNDKEYLWETVHANIGRAAEEGIEIHIDTHDEFLEFAEYAYSKNSPAIAIVLIAIAIEHTINLYYRELLSSKGLQSQEITEIIKRNGIEPKMGWLMTVTGGTEIPDDLKKRLNQVIELRNSVIHYKAVPWVPDIHEDGWTSLMDNVSKMDFDEMLNTFDRLHEFLDSALNELIPARRLAVEAARVMYDL